MALSGTAAAMPSGRSGAGCRHVASPWPALGGGLSSVAAGPGSPRPDGIGRVSRAEGSVAAVARPAIVGLAAGDDVFVDDILRTGAEFARPDRLRRWAADRDRAWHRAGRAQLRQPTSPAASAVGAGPAAGHHPSDRRPGRGRPLDRDRHPHRRGVGPLDRMAGGEHRQGHGRAVARRARSPCAPWPAVRSSCARARAPTWRPARRRRRRRSGARRGAGMPSPAPRSEPAPPIARADGPRLGARLLVGAAGHLRRSSRSTPATASAACWRPSSCRRWTGAFACAAPSRPAARWSWCWPTTRPWPSSAPGRRRARSWPTRVDRLAAAGAGVIVVNLLLAERQAELPAAARDLLAASLAALPPEATALRAAARRRCWRERADAALAARSPRGPRRPALRLRAGPGAGERPAVPAWIAATAYRVQHGWRRRRHAAPRSGRTA